jgi:hypothetical protein
LKCLLAAACALGLYFRIEVFIGLLLWPVVSVAAFWYGGWEARAVTVAIIANEAVDNLSPLYDLSVSRSGIIAVDLAFLAILVFIAVRSQFLWPSWVAAFHLLIVVAHLIFSAKPATTEPWAYLISVVIWSWLMLIALTFGVWDDWAERRKARPSVGAAKPVWLGFVIIAVTLGVGAWQYWHVRGFKEPHLAEANHAAQP